MLTESEIREIFLEEAYRVWHSSLIQKINVNVVIRSASRPLLSLGYKTMPTAIGNSLLVVPSTVTLCVSQRALELPKEEIRALLRHEAIHLGYPRHDSRFRALAEKYNAPITEHLFRTQKYMVQVKDNTERRYHTIKTFGDLKSATEYAKYIANRFRCKVRIKY